jgi:hypothetical protein
MALALRKRPRLSLAATLTFAALTISGCNAVSGLGDYEIDRSTLAPNKAAPTAEPAPSTTSSTSDAPSVSSPLDAGASDVHAPPADAGLSGKRVFVTSQGTNGNLNGLAGADDICRKAAIAAGLGDVEWRAWLSTSKVNAIKRIE